MKLSRMGYRVWWMSFIAAFREIVFPGSAWIKAIPSAVAVFGIILGFEVGDPITLAVRGKSVEVSTVHVATVAFIAVVVLFAIGYAWAWASRERLVVSVGEKDADSGGGNYHYRVEVKNASGVTIEKCGAKLVASDPPMENLPIPLHCTHKQRPESDLIDLDPGDSRMFDVCRIADGMPHFEVTGAGFYPQHPATRSYRITLRIHAKDTTEVLKHFIIEPKDGRLDLREATPPGTE